MPAADVSSLLGSGSRGLAETAALERLRTHGPNALAPPARRSVLNRALAQITNPLIYVLLASAAVTAFLGQATDTAVILGVVALNAAIGLVQEGRAENALLAIREMIAARATVFRDGRRTTIVAHTVVPGDLLILEPGDRVTADARLVKARNLLIDESILTGESVAASKSSDAVDEAAPLAERAGMVFSGTMVASGRGAAVVVATGPETEIGRVTTLLGEVETLTTPLVKSMRNFANQITVAILGLAAAAFAFATLARGYTPADAFMAVVGMAVAAIPEGLPAVMTITLAVGVQRMAARHAIVRRLPAVETLGSVSVICTDKTGTLTQNEMTVRKVATAEHIYDVEGVGYAPKGDIGASDESCDPIDDRVLIDLARAATLCNDAHLRQQDGSWNVEGDPMEGALLSFAMKAGIEPEHLRRELARADELPFAMQSRYMATLNHRHDGTSLVSVKGAPERVMRMCCGQASVAGQRPLDIAYWDRVARELAAEGQRVLAIATKELRTATSELTFAEAEDGLTLLGIVGFIDPPRTEAIDAIRECRSAGIRVVMITGDHAATAAAVAGQLGIDNPGRVITGPEIDKLGAKALSRAVSHASVFARTTPEHKLRLVEALQRNGLIVAMTGDGVNDAAALKRAEIGVAMGRKGTEAAKEASQMVLADDNIASIIAAVREGRTVYDNLIKVLRWTLPTSTGATLVILAAIVLGLPLPMTPVQILWINMVTAVGLGLVLAFEAPEADVMRRPPRAARAPLLTPGLAWDIAFVSAAMLLGAFAILVWSDARGLAPDLARTNVVNAIVAMEIAYLLNVRKARAGGPQWRSLLASPVLLIGVGSVVVLQIAFTYAPVMQKLFSTQRADAADLAAVLAAGSSLFVLARAELWVRHRLFSASRLTHL
jgi:magnesium-transporting ATPase (P-type)